MMALVDAGSRAAAVGAPAVLAAACRTAVAACGQVAADFAEALLAAVIAIKSANFDEMVLSGSPEATMVASACGITVDSGCDAELSLFTLVAPSVDSSQSEGDGAEGSGGPGESLRMAVVHFVALLVHFDAAGPAAVAPRLRARLDTWAAAAQKDCMLDGSVEKLLEIAVIEVCLGMLLGVLRRGPTAAEGGAEGEVEWVLGTLRAGYAAAPTEKGNVWAYAVAVAARIAANMALMHAAAGNVGGQAYAASALQAVVRTLGTLVGAWSGSTSTDTRHACALAYTIDELLQAGAVYMAAEGEVQEECQQGVFSQHSAKAGAQQLLRESCGVPSALAGVLQMAVNVVPRAATHALQTVRAAGAQMTASATAALTAACLVPSARCTADPASLASQLHAAVAAQLDAADAALPAACTAAEGATAAPPSGTEAGSSSGDLERAIGFAAALANSCRHVQLSAPALAGLQQRLLPWSLTAQAVTHPDLQPLMATVRRAPKLPSLSVAAARALLPEVVAAATHEHWQVRISAVQALQPLWYRCASPHSTHRHSWLLAPFPGKQCSAPPVSSSPTSRSLKPLRLDICLKACMDRSRCKVRGPSAPGGSRGRDRPWGDHIATADAATIRPLTAGAMPQALLCFLRGRLERPRSHRRCKAA